MYKLLHCNQNKDIVSCSMDPASSLNTPVWFSEKEYSKVLDGLVIVCVDTLIYDKQNRVLLGFRNKEPIKGWWIFGGRMRAHETFSEAARRGLLRELTLEVPLNKSPEIVGYYDLRWRTRQELPRANGCHVLLVAMKYQIESVNQIGQADGGHDELRWFTSTELESQDLNSYLKRVLRDAGLLGTVRNVLP